MQRAVESNIVWRISMSVCRHPPPHRIFYFSTHISSAVCLSSLLHSHHEQTRIHHENRAHSRIASRCSETRPELGRGALFHVFVCVLNSWLCICRGFTLAAYRTAINIHHAFRKYFFILRYIFICIVSLYYLRLVRCHLTGSAESHGECIVLWRLFSAPGFQGAICSCICMISHDHEISKHCSMHMLYQSIKQLNLYLCDICDSKIKKQN